MLKTAFLQKNVNNFEHLREIFLYLQQIKASDLYSFISASLKSIVTVELAAQIAAQIAQIAALHK